MDDQACENTDRELYREPDETGNGDYYCNSLHVTDSGSIGMNVGGMVHVMPIRDWWELANEANPIPTLKKEPSDG